VDSLSTRPELMGTGRSLLDTRDWKEVGCSLKLSERELQITQHVFDDHKVLTIAEDLGISVHTVNTYFHRLYIKLGVSSRAQLIVRIMTEHFAKTRAANALVRTAEAGNRKVAFINDADAYDLSS